MTIKVGDTLPKGNFSVVDGGVKTITTDDLFGGKKVVLFAVPGAFTPTCSAQHLPGYLHGYEDLKDKGVDTIACMSVNDAFVMHAWGESQSVGDRVLMLADGNGDYARALGLELDGSGFGMGLRSQRFALVADDGKVTALHIEDAGEFRVSSAESILAAL